MSEILYGVEAWVEYLKDRPLPVRNSILRRLKRQLQDEHIPLHKINNTIKSDPVLCLHVVRKASNLHLQKDSKVTGIDHAISSLGLTNIEEITGEIDSLKLNPSSVAQKMYFRSIAISHHAATQSTHWLRSRKAPFIDETYLASLFYGVGHWMLWQHASLHMSQIEVKIREEQIEPVLAETDVLGCSIQEISQSLIEQWKISELAVISLEHETSPNKKTLAQLHQRALGDPRINEVDLREINHLVQEKFFPVKLANWLALAANLGWQQTKTMKVIDIINDFLKGEIANTINMLHQTCAYAAQKYHVAGTLAPAAEMLMINSDTQINYCLSKKEEALLSKTMPAVEKPAEAMLQPNIQKHSSTPEAIYTVPANDYLDKNIYNQIAERFLKGYDLYTEPKHILQGLMQGINKGLGFERAALFIVNTKKQQLKTGLFVGFEDDHPITKFNFSLDVPGLFKKLSQKSACIWIKPENHDQMLHMLPDTYGNWVNPNGFALMSIFYGSSPIAIIHADFGETGPEISEFHNERLRYLCSASSLALKKIKK
ncbi:MAG: HDOD domain-containing protein [Neptuniibacter sp.]